jgi:OOP family OmpA-OmpF porin
MKKTWVLLIAVAGALSFNVAAQTSTKNGYWTQGVGGPVWRNAYGQCWKAAYWTPAMAIPECDPDLAPRPVVTPPPPPPIVKPAPKPAPKPKPVAEKVTLAADVLFDFDKSVVKPDGRSKLDDLANKIRTINLEVVIAIGHADSVGSDAYNQALSVRRAEAVKAYLTSKGIEGNRVYTEGKGEKQPVADNKTAGGRAKNRRSEIEVIGTRKN